MKIRMTVSFEQKIRQLKIWEFLDYSFSSQKDPILQAKIVEFAEKNKLGSKKSVLSILQELKEKNMIKEIELTPEGPGRPKKAYQRHESEEESILVNIGELPPVINNYITAKSKQTKLGKGKVMLQMIVSAFLQFYEEGQYEHLSPYPKPKHLDKPIPPREL
jgi:hypothetical protein